MLSKSPLAFDVENFQSTTSCTLQRIYWISLGLVFVKRGHFNISCASPVNRLFEIKFNDLLKGIFSIVTGNILEFSQVVSRGWF